MEYSERFYRQWMGGKELDRYQVTMGQSDLLILCDGDLERLAREALAGVRAQIEGHIERDPGFATALSPVRVDGEAPEVIRAMARAAERWNVGPMAGVAGAVAQAVGRRLLEECGTVIVENGGDVFVRSDEPVRFGLYAGEESPFSDRIGFEVDAAGGIGVCTSSGRVGPSLSFGRADAVVAIAGDAVEADVAATALANRIRRGSDVRAIVEEQEGGSTLSGLIACAGESIGFWGDIELGGNIDETEREAAPAGRTR